MPTDRGVPDLADVEKTIERVNRLQLARAYTHGRPASDADVQEIFALLGDEAKQGEEVLKRCVRLAFELGGQAVYQRLHQAPNADHEMLDQAARFLETGE